MLCLLWASNVWAQNELNIQHEIGGKSVTQKISIPDNSAGMKITIQLGDQQEEDVYFNTMDYLAYRKELKSYLGEKDSIFNILYTADIQKYLDKSFLEIISWKLFKDEKGPKVGTLKIGDEVDVYFTHMRKNNKTGVKLKIHNLQMEFKEGYIDQIILQGELTKDAIDANAKHKTWILSKKDTPKLLPVKNKDKIVFSTASSVHFSTIKNYRKLNGRIFAHGRWELEDKFSRENFLSRIDPDKAKHEEKDAPEGTKNGTTQGAKNDTTQGTENGTTKGTEDNNSNEKTKIRKRQAYICVSDVLSFTPALDRDTRDYAPENGLLTAVRDSQYVLHREKSADLVTLTVYTDFAGLDEDKPNGLLEFEAYKRIRLWTYRQPILPRRLNLSIGTLQYIRPVFSWTKIEENNRRLELSRADVVDSISGTFQTARFTSPVRALNHQIYALGGELNVLYLDMRSLKSEFFVDYGFRYRRFQVIDSITSPNANYTEVVVNPVPTINPAHAFSHFAELRWKIIPEKRYGFHVAYSIMNISLASQGFDFRSKNAEFKIHNTYYPALQWLMAAELGAYLNTGEAGNTLFLRWRMNWQAGNQRDSFAQVQFGYNISVRTLFKK